jgi:hypothetical protein
MGGQPAPDQAPAQAPAWPTKYQQGRGTSPIPPNMAQINLVKERPDLAELFLNKYGYLPEGVTPQQGGM